MARLPKELFFKVHLYVDDEAKTNEAKTTVAKSEFWFDDENNFSVKKEVSEGTYTNMKSEEEKNWKEKKEKKLKETVSI